MTPHFRAWLKKEKRMFIVKKLEWAGSSLLVWSSKFDYLESDVILMLSTGLKDKNGVEIFKGDIVRMDAGGYFLKETVVKIGTTLKGR